MTVLEAGRLRVDADMKLERFEGTACVQSLIVSSQGDGTVTLAFSGAVPRTTWRQFRELRLRLCAIAEVLDQELVVTNEGKMLIHVVRDDQRKATVSVRWWNVVAQILLGGGKG